MLGACIASTLLLLTHDDICLLWFQHFFNIPPWILCLDRHPLYRSSFFFFLLLNQNRPKQTFGFFSGQSHIIISTPRTSRREVLYFSLSCQRADVKARALQSPFKNAFVFIYLRPEVIKSQGTPVIIAVQNSLWFSVSWMVFKILFQGIEFASVLGNGCVQRTNMVN